MTPAGDIVLLENNSGTCLTKMTNDVTCQLVNGISFQTKSSESILLYEFSLYCITNSIVVIRWSKDHFISIMGIPVLVRLHLYIETAALVLTGVYHGVTLIRLDPGVLLIPLLSNTINLIHGLRIKWKSPVCNLAPKVKKFSAIVWECLSLSLVSKFHNCMGNTVVSSASPSWSLIHRTSWPSLIKAGSAPHSVSKQYDPSVLFFFNIILRFLS